MKRYLILLIVPLFMGLKARQEIDERKMNRDLEIAKNILATLIKGSSSSFIGGESIDASYIKDYGVVFSIPEHLVYFHSGASPVIAIPEAPMPDFNFEVQPNIELQWDEERELSEEDMEQIRKEKERIKEQKERIKEEEKRIKAEIKEAEKERVKALVEASGVRELYVGNGKTSNIDWKEIMVTFMTDYADLIGQLNPTERIVINQKSPFDELVVVWGVGEERKPESRGLSAEVLRKDITAFKAGKITESEFVERITIKESEGTRKVADLEMFASIFDRYYSPDLTETFYSQGKPRYEVLEGFGAIFHIRASTGRGSYARVRYYRPGESWTAQPDSKQDTDDAALYPKFVEGIKEFMLDYGRTIRSLGDKEKVMLNITLTGCRDCKLPKSLEVSADISLLKQYDNQKISREKAMEQIGIKEGL